MIHSNSELTKSLNAKTKDQLIADITKLINESKDDDKSCTSNKIQSALTDFIEKYKPKPAAIKHTNKDLNLTMDIFANTNENSKGYTTHGYKIRVLNEEHPFSSDDEVKYFLTNLFGYIEDSNVSNNVRKENISNYFKPYSKTSIYSPALKKVSDELVNTSKKNGKSATNGGGRKNKRRPQTYKLKKRIANKQKRSAKKTIKKH